MALLPPFMLDCVAAIGRRDGEGVAWMASGFLYGEYEGPDPAQEGQSRYRPFLVTNRHVLDGQLAVVLRFSSIETSVAPAVDVPVVDPSGERLYIVHPDPSIDVAVLPMDVALLHLPGTKFSFFQGDKHTMDAQAAEAAGLSEGDGAYVLGFPMGQVGGDRNYVIVRQGAIARIRDWLMGSAKEFLVDATVFPGNSGGPVVVRPESVSIKGTKKIDRAALIGLVSGYVPYRDVAVSRQTGRDRVIFEENSGLSAVVPFDYIQETIRLHLAAQAAPPPVVEATTESPESGPEITEPPAPKKPKQSKPRAANAPTTRRRAKPTT